MSQFWIRPGRRGIFAAAALLILGSLSLLAYDQSSSTNSGTSSGSSASQGADLNSQMRTAQRELVEEERHAAGEEHETDQFKYSPSVQAISRITGLSLGSSYWLCVVLNFAVIAALIIWIWNKNLPAVFRDRTVAIQKAMVEAKAASDDARKRLAEVEARLAKLDGEIAQLAATGEREVAAEAERIQAAAAAHGRKIVESVEQEIAAAAKNARRELTVYAADLAVGLAGKQLRVDSTTDQGLVREFSRQLGDNGGSRKESKS